MLISHLPNVQELVGVPVVPRPAVHKHSGAAAATIHHQTVVEVGVACVSRIHVGHPRQVPVEVALFPDPAGVAPAGNQQQVEDPDEAEDQADGEQLSQGGGQEPGKNLRGEAEMPGGWEKARKADPSHHADCLQLVGLYNGIHQSVGGGREVRLVPPVRPVFIAPHHDE